MTNPYELFGTDKDLENGSGVSIDYPGFSITLHRAGGSNKQFGKVFVNKLKPHRQKHARGVLEEGVAHTILVETYAETVIIGWEGVKDAKNKTIAFSVENCIKLLTDLPELFEDIQVQANNFATFKAEVEEIEEKNS